MKKLLLKIGIVIVTIAIVLVGFLLIKSKTSKVQNPIATIQIEGYEKPIKIELDPQSAPNAVANFIKLANSGFYNDFKMSIESNRLLGDSSMEMARISKIKENPGNDYIYGIKGDFIKNDVNNLIRHEKGVITMERDDYSFFGYVQEGYNSANCNFALLTEDVPEYNEYYAAFGKVVEGMDVLEAIASTRVEETKEENIVNGEDANTVDNSETEKSAEATEDENKNKITIKSITVDTFGVDYGMPETVNYEENYQKVNQMYSQYFGGNSDNIVAGE